MYPRGPPQLMAQADDGPTDLPAQVVPALASRVVGVGPVLMIVETWLEAQGERARTHSERNLR